MCCGGKGKEIIWIVERCCGGAFLVDFGLCSNFNVVVGGNKYWLDI